MAVTINGVSPTTAQQREFAAAMGLPVLLQTVTVGTAQQDIDFTSLDLDADRIYRIELCQVPNTAADQTVRMFYNSDTTDANYRQQKLYSGGTFTGSTTGANAALGVSGVAPNTGFSITCSMTISKYQGKQPTALGVTTLFDTTTFAIATFGHFWSGTANVTAIKLRHTSNFGVGTVAKIYKV